MISPPYPDSRPASPPSRSQRVTRFMLVLLALWTGAVAALYVSDMRHLDHTSLDLAIAEARVHLDKDQATRLWVASLGGACVAVSENLQPNPFLSHVPDRHIQTPQGRPLTLMNPVYMIFRMMGEDSDYHRVRTHLTTLQATHSETAPDDWERSALESLKVAAAEVMEFTDTGGIRQLRAMRPLVTEAECQRCHASQGHQVGDICGGVSVSVPLAPYLEYRNRDIAGHGVSFGVLWLVGCAGIFGAARRLSLGLADRDRAEELLRLSQQNYRALVDSSLTGIYISRGDTILFGNARFAAIHGYAPEEIVGMAASRLVHPEDWSLAAQSIRRLGRQERHNSPLEVRCVTKDGRTIWVQRRCTLVQYDGATAELGNEIDITQQKAVETELQASEHKLKKLSTQLLQQQEAERRETATEIHEDFAQRLSAIKLRVESLLAGINTCLPGVAADSLQPIVTDVQQMIASARRLTSKLHPLALDTFGIVSAMEWLCRETAELNPGLVVQRHIQIDESQIPPTLKIPMFRSVKSVLENSIRNGDTGTVKIYLQGFDQRAELAIQSDTPFGKPAGSVDGECEEDLEVAAFKSIVEARGGEFRFASSPGKGAFLAASWPLKPSTIP